MAMSIEPRRRDGALIVGAGLIAAGLIATLLLAADIDPDRWLAGSGWTLWVIVPGVALLAGGLLAGGSSAKGLTVAGAVVTTVGIILLAMDRTGHYEAWAYAWAMIPAAAGAGLILHGLRTHDRPHLDVGLRLMAGALAAFLIGYWYFETLFDTGRPPFDVGDAWPLALVVVGGIVVGWGLLVGRRGREAPPS